MTGLYPRIAGFAAILASAGIPLYIHLPGFAAAELGLSLSAIGTILILIRVVDLVQDPALGWLADRYAHRRQELAVLGLMGLAAGFALLFVVPPFLPAMVWLLTALVVLFTSFSLLQILFYGQGVLIAGNAAPQAHLRLAGWRESGFLFGVLLAATAPQLFIALGRSAPYQDFGLMLVGVIFIVGSLSLPLWAPAATPPRPSPSARQSHAKIAWRRLFHIAPLWLLLIGLFNALPVALSSTLFVFFVEDRLQLAEMTGVFLLLFFLAAGCTAPIWTRLAKLYGPRQILLLAMTLSILCFAWAASLPAGATVGFALICIGSGAALSADMVILPALFSTVLSRYDLPEGIGFGLWSFAAKLGLALAAGLALPALEAAGYQPGSANDPAALSALAQSYAVVPSLLKLIAIILLLVTPTRVLVPLGRAPAHSVATESR